MDIPAPQPEPVGPFTVERHFALVDEGVLEPDDRLELLEGVVVAMPPHDTSHACEQDRLTKAMVYAAAGVPEYWIVNVVHEWVEVHRDPDPRARRYRDVTIVRRGGHIELVASPGVGIATDDLLPVLAG